MKMAKAANKEVKVKEETAMAMYEGMDQQDGGGFENADSDSFSVPFIKVLQKMSPQVDEDHDEYIEGAKAGMLFNSVTKKLYPDGLNVIPCHYVRTFLEWVPRSAGGGLVNVFEADAGLKLMASTVRDEETNRDMLPNGNELQDTRVHYMLVEDDEGGFEPAIISLSRTQIKSSKDWMSQMKQWKLPNGNGAAMFAQVWKLGTKKRAKDENTWSVLTADPVGLIFKVFQDNYQSALNDAKSFRDLISSGAAKVNHAASQDDVVEEEM